MKHDRELACEVFLNSSNRLSTYLDSLTVVVVDSILVFVAVNQNGSLYHELLNGVFICNSVCMGVFFVARQTKLDPNCICFENFYSSNNLYVLT
jgi:hypothetical protein